MSTENKLDWTQFTVNMPLNLDINEIIKLWTSQEGLEQWFLKVAEFTRPDGTIREKHEKIRTGDSYKWIWHGWPDSVIEQGTLVEPKNNEFIRFTFGNAGTVSVSMLEQDGESILHLCQENIPQDEESLMNFHVGCKTGWTFYLLNLKSVLLGGPDLRNKNSKLCMD